MYKQTLLVKNKTYIFRMCADVVGRLRIVCALCQPALDGVTVRGGVVVEAALEAKIMVNSTVFSLMAYCTNQQFNRSA